MNPHPDVAQDQRHGQKEQPQARIARTQEKKLSMKRTSLICLALVTLAGGLAFGESADQGLASNAGESPRVKLVFNIDESFGNGVVVSRDTVGMERIAQAIKPLQEFYDVYCLFNPQVKDKQSLEMMLDICVANKVPFLLEIASSHGMAMGGAPQNATFDQVHGLTLSLPELIKYKRKYGESLAGMRFMEIFGQDTMVLLTAQHPEVMHDGYSKAPDTKISFFDPDLYKPYLKYAQDTGMIVQWSEFFWWKKCDWDYRHYARFQNFLALLKQFPGLITVTYANNEPAETSQPRLDGWDGDVKPLVALGAKEWGLSDQAWLNSKDPMACPSADVVFWCKSALDRGSRFIQFEPGFYFFRLPHGTIKPAASDYTKDPKWADRGSPRDSFKELSAYLIKRAKQRNGSEAATRRNVNSMLVLRYVLDEMSGNAPRDASGNNRHVDIWKGTPEWTAGRKGGGLHFNGVDSLIGKNSPEVSPTKTFTVMAWIKPTRTDGVRVVFSQGNSILFLESGKLKFQKGTTWETNSAEGIIPANTWRHVAFTLGEDLPGSGCLYVNGNKTDAKTPLPYLEPNAFYIGGQPAAKGRYFDGVICDFRLYNGALTEAEIHEIVRE